MALARALSTSRTADDGETMRDGRVVLECEEEIARITFERPHARNAMTWEMYEQLAGVLDVLETSTDIRCAVLRGAGGRAFVAGTDIKQFTQFESVEDGLEYERFIDALIDRLEALPLPTIAVVEGYAVGGGLAIAAACDLRICTPDTKFGLPIARTVGNCLSMKNYARLVSLVGAARTRTLILSAQMMPADEARQAGFVMAVVAPDDLDARTEELCARLLRNAPITMRVTKEAILRILAAGIPDGTDLIREAYGSEDFREGVAAFIAKRAPEWRNR